MKSSLEDISNALNVSKTTVSRALSNPNRVSKETRDKVLNYIKTINYQPNISARLLRSKKSNIIGIILNDMADPLIAKAACTMQDIATREGFLPIIFSNDESIEKENLILQTLIAFKASGIVLAPTVNTTKLIKKLLNETPIPIVELDRTTGSLSNDEFRMDNFAAMKLAATYLYNKGSRYIKVISGDSKKVSSFKERCDAIKLLKLKNLKFDIETINEISAPLLEEQAYQITRSLLKNSNSYDGIITINNTLAFGALRAFIELNKIPNEHLNFITIDSPNWLPLLPFKVPSIINPIELAASKAINRLISKIRSDENDNVEQILIVPKLLEE